MRSTALKTVDHVIVVSGEDRRKLLANGLNSERITVIPLGVDVNSFERSADEPSVLRQHYGISKSTTVLFFHGTLHYQPNTEAVAFIADHLILNSTRHWTFF